MNATLDHLIVLQAQDLELKQLRQELSEAPRRVTTAAAARTAAEAALTSAKQSLAKEESLRKSHELDIAGHRTKIARLRKQLETAANATQITALEHEISFAELSISRLEDEELASLERTDTFEAARAAAADALANTTAALDETRLKVAALIEGHTAAIAGIETQRTKLRAEIVATDEGEAALSNYDRISKARGSAVSEARDNKCTACQMMVRPQRWNDLTGRDHEDTIFNCETCGRMLFYDPRRDRPMRWTPGERLAAAS